MNVKSLIIVFALLMIFNISTAQDTDLTDPSLEGLVCGDGVCSDLENCPEDCKPSEETKIPEKEGCVEIWTCSEWSDCTDDKQTRTCTDSNNCGTTNNKPAESKECAPAAPAEKPAETTTPNETVSEEKPVEETPSAEGTSFLSSWTFRIIFITALFLIAGLVIFYVYKKISITPKQPTGIIEEQKITETKPVTPVEEAKINPQLAEYIQTNIKKGFTKEQIKAELLKAGWNAGEIDKALAKY